MAMLVRRLEGVAHLADEERQAILTLPVRTQVLRGKQDIAREGDKPSQCCLILDGWACRYKLVGEGRRQIFSVHIAGDIPDLLSLHLHTMDHNLATVTKATVAFIPHEALRNLTACWPSVAAVLWRDTLIDAAIFREWMSGMGRRSAYERMAHFLCEIYLRLEVMGLASNHRCPLPLTQNDMADALGLTNVHVNRVLKEMRVRGLITLSSGTLVIEAWGELVQASGFDPTYLHLVKPPPC